MKSLEPSILYIGVNNRVNHKEGDADDDCVLTLIYSPDNTALIEFRVQHSCNANLTFNAGNKALLITLKLAMFATREQKLVDHIIIVYCTLITSVI